MPSSRKNRRRERCRSNEASTPTSIDVASFATLTCSHFARIARNEPDEDNLTALAKSRRQLCDRYKITEELVDLLIQLKFLKPTMSGGEETFDANDELRLEVVLKGREHGFSLQEIALLIREEAPRLDGVLI